VDHLWTAGSSTDDLWTGHWGLLRVYRPRVGPIAGPAPEGGPTRPEPTLQKLPSNPEGGRPVNPNDSEVDDQGICPTFAKIRTFNLVATTARKALPPLSGPCLSAYGCGTLIYNQRPAHGFGPLHDPTAILYVRETDLDSQGKLLPGVPVEPLILRARAGDCIKVILRNDLPAAPVPMPDRWGFATLPRMIEGFNMNHLTPSRRVGLHPQLLGYDVSKSDGNDIGINPINTVLPTATATYRWYAGDIFVNDDGSLRLTPIEFGSTGLIPADRIKQPSKGAIGALIIEPQGSTWTEDPDTRAAASITRLGGGGYREFVTVFQNQLNLRYRGDEPVPNLAETEDPEDSGQRALNYRTEPMWFRLGFAPDTPLDTTRTFDFSYALHNQQVGDDPETPVFVTAAGKEVRFRLLHPSGSQRNNVFTLHGHAWEQEPYVNSSKALGDSQFSLFEGAHMGIGPTSHFDVLLQNGAGGTFGVPGDYLYRDFVGFHLDGGQWGLMRVEP
jgi:hypothetical protein